jgi:predicted HTH domain antitoxin
MGRILDRKGERMVTVSLRILRSQFREVERLALTRGLDKSGMVRMLLDMGLRETKLKEALDLVGERKVSVWRAARMAGMDYRTILAALRTHNVPFPLSERELEREFDELTRNQ